MKFLKLFAVILFTGGLVAACASESELKLAKEDAEAARQAQMEAEAATAAAEQAKADAEAATAQAETETAAAEQATADAEAAAEAARAEAARIEAELAAEEAAAEQAMAMQRDQVEDLATKTQTLATNAATVVNEAEMAMSNVAALQTGAMSDDLAMKAKMYADMAQTASNKAAMASAQAAEATDSFDVGQALVDAESAYETAQMSAAKAVNYAQMLVDAVNNDEVNINEMTVNVGDVMIDIDNNGQRTSVTDGDTTITGLIPNLSPKTTSDMVAGVEFMADEKDYVQAVAAKTFVIGKVIDSENDSTRLMVVTKHPDTKNIRVFADGSDSDNVTGRVTENGMIQTAGVGTETETDDRFVTLKSMGTYILAGSLTDNDGLAHTDVVSADAETMNVFVATGAGNDGLAGTADDVMSYVILSTTTVMADGTTDVVYQAVDVTAPTMVDEEGPVRATIPVTGNYDHVNFGVWTSLGEAATNGDQEIAGLGIGFVNADSQTETMPNFGSATYNGSWVASVQDADPDGEGNINLYSGDAMINADFTDGDVTAMLEGLATLKGTISDNMFSGDAVTDVTHMNLDTTADFMGSFSGEFYGEKAVESAGVFDFMSDDNEGGAFRGAFGGARD